MEILWEKGAVLAVDWIDALTRFVLPPILGGAGGLIGVYANWGIEKRRQRLARRRELVTGWRMNLVPLTTARSPDGDLEDLRATLSVRRITLALDRI